LNVFYKSKNIPPTINVLFVALMLSVDNL